MVSGMRGLLAAIERGDMAAPAGLVDRLDGAVLALDALDEPGAPHATKAAMVDTASLLRLLASLVNSGQFEADPAMARALEGAADTLTAVATMPSANEP
jgi:hypothetical protein